MSKESIQQESVSFARKQREWSMYCYSVGSMRGESWRLKSSISEKGIQEMHHNVECQPQINPTEEEDPQWPISTYIL
jgi:hypothetical protein